MTYEEFVIKTRTLEEYFNKEYNDTQRQIMFDELKFYDVTKYENAIRFLCKSNRYRPTLAEILDAMKQNINYSNVEKEKFECEACKGTGYVIYHKKINDYDYEYACLCNCKNAQGLEYDGTKIADKEHRSKFYIDKAEKIFMGA